MRTLSCDKCGQIVEDREDTCKQVSIRDNKCNFSDPQPYASDLFHLCHDCYKQVLQQWTNNEHLMESQITDTQGQHELDCWFSLSYSSFAVMPRVLMDAMSDEWKLKMAKLLQEYDETFNWSNVEIDGSRVQALKDGKLAKMPKWLLDYRRPDKYKIESMMVK